MKLRINKKIKNLITIFISVGLIAYIIYSIGLTNILKEFENLDLRFFILAIALGFFGICISAKKWQILLKAKKESRKFFEVLKYYYIGIFFNLFLPTSVGGDIVKAYKMSKTTKESVDAYSSVFMERFTGLTAILTLAFCSTTIYFHNLPTKILLIVYVILIPGFFCVSILLFKDL